MGEPSRHRTRLLFVDRPRFVVRLVQHVRHDAAGTNALDAVRAAPSFGHRRRCCGLERHDSRAAAAFAQRARHAAQHAAGPHRAAVRVEPAAGLLEQLAADAGVAVERVGVVKLIGPERVRLGRQLRDRFLEALEERGRHLAAVARHHPQLRAERAHRLQLFLGERI